MGCPGRPPQTTGATSTPKYDSFSCASHRPFGLGVPLAAACPFPNRPPLHHRRLASTAAGGSAAGFPVCAAGSPAVAPSLAPSPASRRPRFAIADARSIQSGAAAPGPTLQEGTSPWVASSHWTRQGATAPDADFPPSTRGDHACPGCGWAQAVAPNAISAIPPSTQLHILTCTRSPILSRLRA